MGATKYRRYFNISISITYYRFSLKMLWIFEWLTWLLEYVFLCVSAFSPGLWKVVAKFHSNPQQSYSAEFEVKEYGQSLITCMVFQTLYIHIRFTLLDMQWTFLKFSVLSSFEVKLTPVRPFFYVDSPDFTVNIRATYVRSGLTGRLTGGENRGCYSEL